MTKNKLVFIDVVVLLKKIILCVEFEIRKDGEIGKQTFLSLYYRNTKVFSSTVSEDIQPQNMFVNLSDVTMLHA